MVGGWGLQLKLMLPHNTRRETMIRGQGRIRARHCFVRRIRMTRNCHTPQAQHPQGTTAAPTTWQRQSLPSRR